MKPHSQAYADIIHLNPPASGRHPRMCRTARGAQFAPFAALTGYDAVLRETGRLTDRQPRLEEDEILRLNRLLCELAREPEQEAAFICFVPDPQKEGGSFCTHRGRVLRVDALRRTVLLDTGAEFPISGIYDIRGD